MKENIPFFEINGIRYEIKRTRYLQAETEKYKDEVKLSDEEQASLAKEEEKTAALQKLATRKDELYAKYLDTFSDDDEAIYNKALKAYEKLLDEIAKGSNISGIQANKIINIGEKIIIKALQYGENGSIIRSEDESTEIWQAFVEDCGKSTAREFIIYTMNYILGTEETESPFVTQAKARAEQRANMKKGISAAK